MFRQEDEKKVAKYIDRVLSLLEVKGGNPADYSTDQKNWHFVLSEDGHKEKNWLVVGIGDTSDGDHSKQLLTKFYYDPDTDQVSFYRLEIGDHMLYTNHRGHDNAAFAGNAVFGIHGRDAR